jgi:hypothetical protein
VADPRRLELRIPTHPDTTHFEIQFSEDRVEWDVLDIASVEPSVTLIPVSDLSEENVYVLDGINTDKKGPKVSSTPPMWYRFRLKSDAGFSAWSAPFVVPSPEDFLNYMKRRLADPSLTGGVALMSDTDYLDRLSNAVDAFEQSHPHELSEEFTLTASTQTYRLPLLWDDTFSRVQSVEYPVKATDPRSFIRPEDVVVDRVARQWRFINGIYPGTGEKARLSFTVRHHRDGSSVPAHHFESVALWATGDAAEALALRFNQFGDASFGAQVIDPGDRVKQFSTMGQELKRQAVRIWGSARTGTRGRISHYDDHGRVNLRLW